MLRYQSRNSSVPLWLVDLYDNKFNNRKYMNYYFCVSPFRSERWDAYHIKRGCDMYSSVLIVVQGQLEPGQLPDKPVLSRLLSYVDALSVSLSFSRYLSLSFNCYYLSSSLAYVLKNCVLKTDNKHDCVWKYLHKLALVFR